MFYSSFIWPPKKRTLKDIIKDQINENIKVEYDMKEYFIGYFRPRPMHIKELEEVVEESFPQYLRLLNTIILLK